MLFQTLTGALVLAGSSTAFSDSSPWVLFSTSPFSDAPESKPIQTSSQVLDYTNSFLQSCPTDRYLIVNQPGVTAADFRGPKGCGIPSLCSAVEDSRNKGKFVVPEVIGDASFAGISETIKEACGSKAVTVEELVLTSLPSDDRAGALSENNAILSETLAAVTADDTYTILFVSTPGELIYEADFAEPVQMDLRRNVQHGPVQRQGNQTDWDRLPLFEKYQFFTPGIFMGLVVTIILFSILGVGLKALNSLEVPYGAFDKDMGPAAQKKQQ